MNWEVAAHICEQLLVDAKEVKLDRATIAKMRRMHAWILDNHACTTRMAAALGQIRAVVDQKLRG